MPNETKNGSEFAEGGILQSQPHSSADLNYSSAHKDDAFTVLLCGGEMKGNIQSDD
jgi:hypothetical protein